MQAEALMISATRPKEVLLKYKELVREAARDEETLISLENRLRLIMLDKSKVEQPWELITQPTLSRFPIRPQRRNIALFGFILGIISGLRYLKKSYKYLF